jgi:hypothetical protein
MRGGRGTGVGGGELAGEEGRDEEESMEKTRRRREWRMRRG